MLVARSRLCFSRAASSDAELRSALTSQIGRLSGNELAENLRERNPATPSFRVEHRQIVSIGRKRRPPSHASDASIIALSR